MERPFDFSKYAFTLRNGSIKRCLDRPHTQILHLLAMKCQGTVVEIGSWRGSSTSALVEAMNKGAVDTLHVFELKPTPSLERVLSMATRGTVHLHTKPSWDFISDDTFNPSLVFIDGNHGFGAPADALWALSFDPKVIAMHDSTSWPKLPGCWGAHRAANMLRRIRGRVAYEDCKDRKGMMSWRGLFMSCKDDVDMSDVTSFIENIPG